MTQSAVFAAVPTGSGQQVREDLNLSDHALATEHEGSSAPSPTYPFMRWRNDAAKLLYRRTAANAAWQIVENYGATRDPSTGDDAAAGYVAGAMWINVAAGHVFFCADPSPGAAVWLQPGGAGGGGAITAVFGRTGSIAAQAGDYAADQISDGGGKVMMTGAERTTLAAITFPAKIIPLNGTASSADTTAIRAAIAAIKASGQPGVLSMSGDFMIGHPGDLSGIDPDTCPELTLTARGGCRWYKGVAATTSGLAGSEDPDDGTAYRLLERTTDDGPAIRKTLIIDGITFEGDLQATMKQLGDASRLIALDHYERLEFLDVTAGWSSQMGISANFCDVVRIRGLHLHHIARDGFNCSDSSAVSCVDSDFEWILDDCFAANLWAGVADDPGQQRAFLFTGNRIYQCQGVKFLGAKNVLVAGNIFRAPMNYAVYAGSDASFGEGVRPLQDIVIANNQITDLIASDRYGNPYPIDTAILVSQWDAAPENVIVRANTLAQRTATAGKSWSDLRLRGIAGENRQFRLQPDGSVVWYDGTLVDEAFVGNGTAIRIEAPNGLDRITFSIEDNDTAGFSDDEIGRSTILWSGSYTWVPQSALSEVPLGASARMTGLDARGYRLIRLVATTGGQGGLAATRLVLRYSVDGGVLWADTGAELAIDGSAEATFWGGWAEMPDALRQSIDVQLSVWTADGNGTAQLTLTDLSVDIENLERTSAARLLPQQITPDEAGDPVGTALRSFSPADVARIASAYGGGGGAQPAFARIAVSGQTTVQADAALGTLTLAGVSGIAVTTDPATDTVTLAPSYGAGANTVCEGNDVRLSDARTPTAHAASHKTGGGDAIRLDELAAPTDVTTLNASASAHGLCPKLSSVAAQHLDGTGTWSAPPYDILCGIVGTPANGEVVLLFVAPRPFRIPANGTGSQLKAGTAATGSAVFSVEKNGVSVLSATVAASATTATFSGSPADFAAGDVLRIVAPATADATLGDIAITLVATLL